MRKIPLHNKIIIGLVLGLLFGLISIFLRLDPGFTSDYIKPIGALFVRLLKMVAMPLVLASLIVGVANLGDISKLSKLGGRTIMMFFMLTVVSTATGLLLVNLLKPGNSIPEDVKNNLLSEFNVQAESRAEAAAALASKSPLQPLVDMVPENIFMAATSNVSMLQVVVFAIFAGIALLALPESKRKPVVVFFDGLNDMIIKMVEYIMMIAPYGVFALIASLIVDVAGDNPDQALELLGALLFYSITVLAGLLIVLLLVYPLLLRMFSNRSFFQFMKGLRPAQLLGFSTSSSSATLPVTMDCVIRGLGVREETASFVLPLGATINMNGTSLYQGVAAVFIAQVLGMELTITDQLVIVLTATLAAIGSAGVPGAGMVMLVIVLEAVGIPAAGIALIVAPDRILDMCRTILNVTGDALTAVAVDSANGDSKAN
jgi:proton glutamate symport protein